MRLWTIHPQNLDRQGLIALWREGLLAQKVLEGKTKGYKHHPQLLRFQTSKDPLGYIGTYLFFVAAEAKKRSYNFNFSKIKKILKTKAKIKVTRGQIIYETEHLLKKLKVRDPVLFKKMKLKKSLNTHPLFKITQGGIELWERLN